MAQRQRPARRAIARASKTAATGAFAQLPTASALFRARRRPAVEERLELVGPHLPPDGRRRQRLAQRVLAIRVCISAANTAAPPDTHRATSWTSSGPVLPRRGERRGDGRRTPVAETLSLHPVLHSAGSRRIRTSDLRFRSYIGGPRFGSVARNMITRISLQTVESRYLVHPLVHRSELVHRAEKLVHHLEIALHLVLTSCPPILELALSSSSRSPGAARPYGRSSGAALTASA